MLQLYSSMFTSQFLYDITYATATISIFELARDQPWNWSNQITTMTITAPVHKILRSHLENESVAGHFVV